MKTIKTFMYRGFNVDITKVKGGYLYAADRGVEHVENPNPELGYRDGVYPTARRAEEAARQDIVTHDLELIFVKLPARDQFFVLGVAKHLLDGVWKVNPESSIAKEMIQAGTFSARR